jgi:hypothetical protein
MGTVEVLRGRAVFGRVIGPDGDGVAGASVLAARQLFGDGTTLGAGHGARVDDLVGMRRATTDPVGGFRITGISHREGVIAAEHAAIGRSKFVSIAAGDQNAHIDLSLVAFGRLMGTVTAGGAPATRATISAAQSGTQNPAFVVTDADGTYVFPKLPAGDYQVSALIQEGVSSGMREARQVTVAAGKDTTLDIDVDVDAGTITLVVKIVPEGSDQIAWAQVLLANAQVSADNGKQLNEAFLGGNAADGQWATAADGKQATFERLTPATYSACVIPMAGSVNDPAIHERVQRCREHVKVYCERVTVNDAPERQSYTAAVPAMRDLPDCDH